MTGILNALIAGVSGAVKDAYFNLVSLLLPGNGTNGAQNNTFLDGSSNNFTITRNGNTTQGTFSPFSQTGWGGYFNASNYLTATLTGQTPGTGSVTYECWVYPTNLSTTRYVFNTRPVADTTTGILCQITSGGNLQITYSGLALFSGAANNIVVNQWQHIAVVRNGSTNWTVYVNGTSIGTFSNSVNLTSDYLSIGSVWTSASFLGYISNLRIVNGVVVPPSGGPTSPLTAVSGTSILTLQSNRFKDNSTNNFTVTSNGSVTITPFSPLAPTQSYSAAAVGGSGYFDGTGDYLSIANNAAFDFAAGAFTIEFWWYPTTVSIDQNVMSKWWTGGSQWVLQWRSSGYFRFAYNSSALADFVGAPSTPIVNAWNHIAIVRSGNSLYLYLNGVRNATVPSITATLTATTDPFVLGQFLNSVSNYLTGYVCGLRIVKGGALYTDPTITVPTTPPTTTVSSGTVSLLLNFTNAGVVDATAKNVLETVGNAQISTTQSKWGGGSIYLPQVSTTDYLKEPSTIIFSGDFVIEGWIYFSSSSTGFPSLFSGTTSSQLQLQFNSTGATYYFSFGGSTIINAQASGLSTDTWTHFAIVRSGTATNNISVYFGGTRKNQATSTATVTQALLIGVDGSAANPFKGYVDDLRITLGNTRGYSGASITVPSAPFPLQ